MIEKRNSRLYDSVALLTIYKEGDICLKLRLLA